MAATINPSENGALLGFTGAKFGRDAVPSLLVACDSASGNPYPLVRDETTKGLKVQDGGAGTLLAAISGYLATLAAASPLVTPTHARTFNQILAGVAVQVVPAANDSLGKSVVNASCAGGVPGADMWIGKDNTVTSLTGFYLPPGSALQVSGRAAVFAIGTGDIRAFEEYV